MRIAFGYNDLIAETADGQIRLASGRFHEIGCVNLGPKNLTRSLSHSPQIERRGDSIGRRI